MSEPGVPAAPAGPAAPAPPPRRRVSAATVVAAVAVVAVIAIAARVREREDIGIVEVGFSEVHPADGYLVGAEPAEEEQPVLSWAVVVENRRRDQVAHATWVDIELLDDDGDVVVDNLTALIDVLPPNQRAAVTGTTSRPMPGVVDVRVEIDRTERWEPTDVAPAIEVDDLEVSYTSTNQPIVRFTATSRFEATIRERTVNVVYRDGDGRIVAGSTSVPTGNDLPLEPGEPVRDATWPPFTVADLATVEVYVEPAAPR
jgi:hypothetical protein